MSNNKNNFKVISLPKLNGLEPTIESTALKLMEEAGELAQVIGKYRGQSGENIVMDKDAILDNLAQELLDVAQVAVSMMFVLEENYDIDIDEKIKFHIQKLKNKGYIV